MFGIGAGELLVLMALALIIIGPQKLPETGRTIGRTIAEFKAYTDDMRSAISFEPQPTRSTTYFPGSAGSPTYSDAVVLMSSRGEVEEVENQAGTQAFDEGASGPEEAAPSNLNIEDGPAQPQRYESETLAYGRR